MGETHQGGVLSSAMRRDSGFPIANRIEDFEPKKIRAVAPEGVTVIEQLQPYHRDDPERHRLAVLHRLSNLDKHRVLHLGFFKLGVTGHYPERADLIRTGPKLLEDGAEIAASRWFDPPKKEMEVNPSFTIQVTLDEKGTEYIRGANGFLDTLIRYVRDRVIDPLSGYL